MKKAIIITASVIVIIAMGCYLGSCVLLLPRNHADIRMDNTIIHEMDTNGRVRLSDMTAFDWDEAFYFWEPYIGENTVGKAIGADVKKIRSGTSEEYSHLFFVKDGQVVYQYMLSYPVRIETSPYLNDEGFLDIDFIQFMKEDTVFRAEIEDGNYKLFLIE